MARTAVEQKDFTFVAGLNTEAGFLTFPPNTWLEGDNMIPQVDGSVKRRLKIDYESLFQFGPTMTPNQKDTFAFVVYRWEAVGGDGNLSFFVVQDGRFVRFYNLVDPSITPNRKSFSIDLDTYKSSTTPNTIGISPIQCSSGNGKLLICSEDTEPILVTYNASSDTITVTEQNLEVRDFVGLDDGLAVDENPATRSVNHEYNLKNQGWDTTKITAYQASQTTYPSNAQIWFQGKNATDDFTPALLVKQFFGSSEAPKGRFLLEVFNRDRTSVSGVATIPVEIEAFRPRSVAFFAGRAWYAGIPSKTIGSWVLFSQVVTGDDKYAKCYQAADTTSEFTPDLVDSDGGVIPIPEAGSVVKLVPLASSLFVFAENGVWKISGGTGGFAATDYNVDKITSFGAISPSAIVEIEEAIAYWSNGGIFILARDQVSAEFTTKSLSNDTVQTLYASIPNENKRYAQGIYNPETGEVMWLFKSTPNTDLSVGRFIKDRFLILDTRLKAFYTHTIASLAGDSPVIVSGGLAVNQENSGNVEARIEKFLTVGVTSGQFALTFSDFEAIQDTSNKFKDWFSVDLVGIETTPLPFITTGYKLAGEGSKEFQTPRIITHMKRTETGFDSSLEAKNTSGCLMQARWQWSNNELANRWSTSEQIYRHRRGYIPTGVSDIYDDGFPVVTANSKARGKGMALHIKYACESGKDCQLIGWSILYNVNTNVR